ncbi:MAG: hypothetical protein DRO88_05265 [Promethearchaeia archaeon]|nr:MAG: hypothetical protein DRO88_05265 [Candidatus Lokiarchaeia archaeon]
MEKTLNKKNQKVTVTNFFFLSRSSIILILLTVGIILLPFILLGFPLFTSKFLQIFSIITTFFILIVIPGFLLFIVIFKVNLKLNFKLNIKANIHANIKANMKTNFKIYEKSQISVNDLLNSMFLSLSYWCFWGVFIHNCGVYGWFGKWFIFGAYEGLILPLIGIIWYRITQQKYLPILKESRKIASKEEESSNSDDNEKKILHQNNQLLEYEQFTNVPKKSNRDPNTINTHPSIKINKDIFLLILFIFLLSVFTTLHFPFLPAEDDWYHVKISQAMLLHQDQFLSTAYRGNLSYHFIGALLALGSGQDMMVVGHWIGLLQIPLACMLFFSIVSTILPKKNNRTIAILSTFLFALTALGTLINFSQFWPTALSTLIGFQLYLNFFTALKRKSSRLQNNMTSNETGKDENKINAKIKNKERTPQKMPNYEEKPDEYSNKLSQFQQDSSYKSPIKKINLKKERFPSFNSQVSTFNLQFFFIQSILIIASISTHVINTLFFLLPLLGSLTFVLIRDRSFLKIWFLYFGGLISQMIFNPYSFVLFFQFSRFDKLEKILVLITSLLIISVVLIFFERYVNKDTYNPKKSQKNYEKLPKTGWAVKVEHKFLFQIIIPTLTLIITAVLIILNAQNSYRFPTDAGIIILVIFVTAVIIICSYMAVILFRNYNFLGKFHYLNLMFISGLVLILILSGTLSTFVNRVLQLFSFYFFIGFSMYLWYKYRKFTEKKQKQRFQIFQGLTLSFLLISTFIGITYQLEFKNYISSAENSFLANTTRFLNYSHDFSHDDSTNGSNFSPTCIIIGGFKWKHPFNYYAYFNINLYTVEEFQLLWNSDNETFNNQVEMIKSLNELRNSYHRRNVFFYFDSSYCSEGIYLTDLKYFGSININQLNGLVNGILVNRVAVGGTNNRVLYWFRN